MTVARQISYVFLVCCAWTVMGCLNYSTTSDVNLKGSLIGFDAINVPADGLTRVESWVHVATANGDPVPGATIGLIADGVTVVQPNQATDEHGLATAILSSELIGTPIVRAQLAYGELRYTLTATESINFYELINGKSNQIWLGKPFHAQVSMRTSEGKPDRYFQGQVAFRSTDPMATFPEPYTFSSQDLGHKIWAGGVSFRTAGQQKIEIYDTMTHDILFTQTMEVITPDAERLKVEVELLRRRLTAGRPERIILRLVKADGTSPQHIPENLIFESSDQKAVFPTLQQWQLQSDGSWVGDIYAATVGDHRLLARVGESTSQLELFSVEPAEISTFSISATSSVTAGRPFSISITALDKFGNIAWGFRGPIALYASDVNALLPTNLWMGPAQQGMLTQLDGVEIYHAGRQRLWVEAEANNKWVAGELYLDVAPATATLVQLEFDRLQSVVNEPVIVQLSIQDPFKNRVGFNGQTIQCRTSDPIAEMFEQTVLSQGDDTLAFQVRFRTSGTLSISCTDINNPSLTGTSSLFTSLPGLPEKIMIWGYQFQPLLRVLRGYPVKTYLGVVDQYNNIVENFHGPIRLQADAGLVDGMGVITLQPQDRGKTLLRNDLVFRVVGNTRIQAESMASNNLQGIFSIDVQAIDHLFEGLGYSTCAITTDDVTKCWGFNFNGQLGLGDNIYRGSSPGQMGSALPSFQIGTNRTVVALSTGAAATCAITDIGQLICFGDNQNGMLGQGDKLSRGTLPQHLQMPIPSVPLGQGRIPIDIRLGVGHGCALLDNQRVKCWGENQSGQLGVGDTLARGDMPQQMGDLLPYTQHGLLDEIQAVAAGQGHTCLLTASGDVSCVGDNVYGQLGVGDALARGHASGSTTGSYALLGTSRRTQSVACGAYHTCALDDLGQVRCFGENSYGQLGVGDNLPRGINVLTNNRLEVTTAIQLPNTQKVMAMSLGGTHTCMLLLSGQVLCLGDNRDGKLGIGDTNARGTSRNHLGEGQVTTGLGRHRLAVQLVAGVAQTCVVLDDGRVKCWGTNSLGQLGLGDTIHRGGDLNQMNDQLPAVLLDGY